MLSWIDDSAKKIAKRHRDRVGNTPSKVTDKYVRTLHPTKGWRFISQARIEAGMRMASMLDNVLFPRSRKKPKVYEDYAIRRANGLLVKRKFPPTVTRQQRRRAKRKGIALAEA